MMFKRFVNLQNLNNGSVANIRSTICQYLKIVDEIMFWLYFYLFWISSANFLQPFRDEFQIKFQSKNKKRGWVFKLSHDGWIACTIIITILCIYKNTFQKTKTFLVGYFSAAILANNLHLNWLLIFVSSRSPFVPYGSLNLCIIVYYSQ